MTERPDGQVSLFDQDTWYGKTSLVPRAANKAVTSRPSSKKQSASQSRKPPIFKCLTRDGQLGGGTGTWTDDGAWLGACSTRNGGESPNAAVESRLSQILEERPHTKYSLTPKACMGILRRAEKRGKDLPEALKEALLAQSASGGGCDGGGKGALVQTEKSGTLGTGNDQTLFTGCLTPYDTQTNRVYGADGIWPTLPAQENSGQNRQSVFCVPINDKATRFSGGGDTRKDDGAGNGLGVGHDGEPSPTLTAADRHGVYCAGFKLGNSEQARSIGYQKERSPTLNAECGGNKPAVVYSFDSLASNSMKSPNPKSGCREVDTARTLDTTSPDPSKNQGGIAILDMSHANDVIRECGAVVPTLQSRMGTGGNQVPLTYAWERSDSLSESNVACTQSARQGKSATDLSIQHGIVRRLTPLECERLQNFPDGWTDIGAWTDEKGKLHKESSDSARYKALGNSIALPPWKWILKRLCAQYERDTTLGSLFDGLGGFPLLWMQLNGWNSVKWASEIEPFCIAVTKRHFGDEKNPGDAWKYLIGAQKDG